MRVLHFSDDTHGYDSHYVPVCNVNMVQVTNATTVVVFWSTSEGDVGDDFATLTVTSGQADECGLAISEQLCDAGIGGSGVTKIQAGTQFTNSYGFDGSDLITVAYTAGT
jgi:hypothetical protein